MSSCKNQRSISNFSKHIYVENSGYFVKLCHPQAEPQLVTVRQEAGGGGGRGREVPKTGPYFPTIAQVQIVKVYISSSAVGRMWRCWVEWRLRARAIYGAFSSLSRIIFSFSIKPQKSVTTCNNTDFRANQLEISHLQ